MSTIPRKTILALARSLHRSVLHCTPLRLSLLRSPSSGLQRGQRQFSASTHLQVQYTRFTDGYTYHGRRPDRNRVARVLVFVTAAGVVYYVAQYVDNLRHSRLFTNTVLDSLEQVPETGRWRFMDISPRFEAKLEKASYASLLSEFQDKILPPHHPITHHVHRVVSDLLEASDLGTLHSTNPRKPPADDGLWSDDSFATTPPRDHHASSDGTVKEWNLLVVNDPKIVNALASFGM